MYTTLITAEALHTQIAQGRPLRIFDCSFDLTRASLGRQQYLEGHIPAAVYADLDTDLSDKRATADPAPASGGRHPLPHPDRFAAWLRSVGVEQGMQIVAYDRQGSSFCGRLWWMLKWVGHEPVAVLDGGLQAWQASGGALESGPGPSAMIKGNFSVSASRAELIAVDEVAGRLGQDTIVDARAEPRYRGEVEPLDPVAGHIPGALNRPYTLNMSAEGRFKPAEELRQEFLALLGSRSADTVVHQCGSGVTATANLLAMEIAGLGRARLFAGSWSQWCSDPARPVERGPK
jgi:thiosulfate/3-mercaptopyruvate sulfurtransferase